MDTSDRDNRFHVVETPERLVIDVGPARPRSYTSFLLCWLTLWLCGPLIVFGAHAVRPTTGFRTMWTAVWAVLVVHTLFELLWLSWGRERLVLGHGQAELTQRLFGCARTRRADLAAVLARWQQVAHRPVDYTRMLLMTPARPWRWATRLSEAEARYLTERINEHAERHRLRGEREAQARLPLR